MDENNIIKVTSDHKLIWRGQTYPCALGKGGVSLDKKEGDGATPVGTFPLRRVLYRSDRIDAPQTGLEVSAIDPQDGWCDDPAHPEYNKPVHLPFSASHEELWRDDHIYDVIVIMGHNDDPVIPNDGSAVFFHLARDQFKPTEGCVAVTLDVMRLILKESGPHTAMDIAL